MKLNELRNGILALHVGRSQEEARVREAFRQLESALSDLARMGHVLSIDGPPEWPKMLFHVHAAPKGRLVGSKEELEALGDGWFETAAEAQSHAGSSRQFQGRGGQSSGGLPVVVEPAAWERREAKWPVGRHVNARRKD